MPGAINRFIVRCSESWWKIVLIFIGQSATFQVLNRITGNFPALTAGDIPFDMQNSLTTAQIFSQLSGYSDEAFRQYWIFQAVDYLFPLFAGLLLAVICAAALRTASPRLYQIACERHLFLLLLIPTVFDWSENLGLLWTVAAWPEQADFAASLAVAAKMGKLTTMLISFAATAILLLWGAGVYAHKFFRPGD